MSWISKRTLNSFQQFGIKVMKTGHIPRHVAFIMDGNRRYAKKQQVSNLEGHVKGFDKISKALNWCMELGIVEITVYAFSIENFKRDNKEVEGFMQFAKTAFEGLLKEKYALMEAGICIRIIGNLLLIPEDLRKLMAEVITFTRNNNKVFFNIAFAYTSRDEITHAIKDIAEGVKYAHIMPEDINEDLMSDCLYTYNSSNPDLLIRTSGEVRFSDFLMWQISSTCVYFTDVLWPELGIWDLLSALFYYQRCYPDLQKAAKLQCPEPNTYNDRVSMYIKNLRHKRKIMIENMLFPTSSS